MSIGNAIAKTITIGNETGATALNLKAGTGNIDIQGVAATTITIGDAAQTGTIGLGVSTADMTLNLGTGAGVHTINIGTGGTGADVITIGGNVGTLAIDTGDWDISTTGAMTGIGAITSDGAIATTSSVKSSSASAGIGYATGAGCAVTQITSRTTGVTCTGVSGAITTDTTSLAAEADATFTVTNTSVAIGDVIVLSERSGSNGGMTSVEVGAVAAGSFNIDVVNNNAAGGTAETGAIIINFAVIKAVSS